MTSTITESPIASNSQVSYLEAIFAEIARVRPDLFEAHYGRFQRLAGIPGEWNDGEPNPPRTMTSKVASDSIKWGLAITGPLPKRTPAAPAAAPTSARFDFKSVSDGNYAVREDDVVKFYRVSTGKTGFKRVQVRASDQLWPVSAKGGAVVLRKIAEAGLAASRLLFVTELERCCKCYKSLTDEESRRNARTNGGYGPDCAQQ